MDISGAIRIFLTPLAAFGTRRLSGYQSNLFADCWAREVGKSLGTRAAEKNISDPQDEAWAFGLESLLANVSLAFSFCCLNSHAIPLY